MPIYTGRNCIGLEVFFVIFFPGRELVEGPIFCHLTFCLERKPEIGFHVIVPTNVAAGDILNFSCSNFVVIITRELFNEFSSIFISSLMLGNGRL